MGRIRNFSLMKFYIQPICIAVIFYINYLWLIDRVLFRKKPVQFILHNVLLIVVANVAIYLVHRMIIPDEFLFRRPGGPRPPRPGLMQWQDSITLALMVGLSVAIKMTQKWIVTEKERKQLEQERTEAELKNLKNQLNPHFLFNTLNNHPTRSSPISPDRAQSAVLELSKMLRYVLYENTQPYVPMEKELEFNHNYIELMRLRLARHVKVEVDMPRGAVPRIPDCAAALHHPHRECLQARHQRHRTLVCDHRHARTLAPVSSSAASRTAASPKTRTTKAARASGSKPLATARTALSRQVHAACRERCTGSTARRSPST